MICHAHSDHKLDILGAQFTNSCASGNRAVQDIGYQHSFHTLHLHHVSEESLLANRVHSWRIITVWLGLTDLHNVAISLQEWSLIHPSGTFQATYICRPRWISSPGTRHGQSHTGLQTKVNFTSLCCSNIIQAHWRKRRASLSD